MAPCCTFYICSFTNLCSERRLGFRYCACPTVLSAECIPAIFNDFNEVNKFNDKFMKNNVQSMIDTKIQSFAFKKTSCYSEIDMRV